MNITTIAKQLGALGGKKSVQARFHGKTAEEKSAMMRQLRYSKINLDKTKAMANTLVKNLRKNTQKPS